MRFVKIPAIFSTVSDLGCIFNGTRFPNKIFEKSAFSRMHLFFILFSLQFHDTATMFSSKMFQTVFKRTLYKHSLKPYVKH